MTTVSNETDVKRADGRVVATWTAVDGTLRVSVFDDVSLDELVAEGERLAAFLGADGLSVERT